LEAVEEAETFRPDVILLDIGMPKLNGYEAARRIRERGWSQGTKLVALTGWGRDDDKHKAAEAGFDRHFTKPIDPAVLERLIADFRSS
jgi:CheY-like chemotaxis protein